MKKPRRRARATVFGPHPDEAREARARANGAARPRISKPTRSQQLARKRYLERTGNPVSKKHIATILSQWKHLA